MNLLFRFFSFDAVTGNVQGVSLCSIDDTTYTVSCTYLNGSSSRGCTYTLTGGSPDAHLTGTVERSNVEGDILEITQLSVFSSLWAVDADSASGDGSVAVNGSLSPDLIKECEDTGRKKFYNALA